MNDRASLQSAFVDTEGVFILLPPNFDPSEGFPEARDIIANLDAALQASGPARVVCLSTIGAQATQINLLSQLGILEEVLGKLPMPVAFLRAAWFMENASWDIAPARESGIVPSFLQPLDQALPMVATADIGQLAAELLVGSWNGHRVIELQGPVPVSPDDVAASLGAILASPVKAHAVPRADWEAMLRSQGAADLLPRMLDGFNEGWIRFEGGERGA